MANAPQLTDDPYVVYAQSPMVELKKAQATLHPIDGMKPGVEYLKKVLDDMYTLMTSKGRDYSGKDHTWHSFEEAARLMGVSPEMSFKILLGTKITRMTSLLQAGYPPTFESLDDTFQDMANYIVLYLAWLRWNADGRPGDTSGT